jgi:Amt family ammonium transporter
LSSGAGLTKKDVRRIWVLLAAVLVFFMQAGFKCLEVGTARVQHSGGTALLNLGNWLVVCIIFWVSGFAVMFADWPSLASGRLFAPGANDSTAFGDTLRFEFFLFQLAFAATAATIVDGALAERVTLPAYYLIALAVGAVIYPVYGHWAWGGAIDGTTPGWLLGCSSRTLPGQRWCTQWEAGWHGSARSS